MTIGEDRVRVKFNPSDNSLVSHIKQKSALLIDLCEENKTKFSLPGGTEVLLDDDANRLWEHAQDFYELAAIYAVKAATSEK